MPVEEYYCTVCQVTWKNPPHTDCSGCGAGPDDILTKRIKHLT